MPFLYQENKFITSTYDIPAQPEEGEGAKPKTISRSGLSVTVSRIEFPVTEKTGFQKPKPRQYMKPSDAKQPERKPESKPEIDPKEAR